MPARRRSYKPCLPDALRAAIVHPERVGRDGAEARMGAESERVLLAELLFLLAHDIKNPLAAVLTNLGFVGAVLADSDDVDDAREALVDARLACESLQRFVGNLELIARDVDLPRERVISADALDLHSVADEVVGREREAAGTRRLTLMLRGHTARTYAHADRDLALRVTDNLVANAMQHAPSGTTIEILLGRRLPRPPSGRAHGGAYGTPEVELVVIDRGPIIPAEIRNDAVSAVGQGNAKRRPDGRYGRGLALYVASIAARAAGGRLEIEEREGLSALALVLPEHEDYAGGE